MCAWHILTQSYMGIAGFFESTQVSTKVSPPDIVLTWQLNLKEATLPANACDLSHTYSYSHVYHSDLLSL